MKTQNIRSHYILYKLLLNKILKSAYKSESYKVFRWKSIQDSIHHTI